MYIIRNTTRQKVLLEQDRRIFRTTDLAILWQIENPNTLRVTISRYIKRKILYKIYKGLYSTIPLKKLHPFELGCAIAGPGSYVSTETVLSRQGIIMQSIHKITLLGQKNTQYTINGTSYLCRYLNPSYLLNRQGIIEKSRYTIATTNRAIADMQHLNTKYYFDNQLAINKKALHKLNLVLGYNDYSS